jgi:hypothetical protein
VQRLSDGALGQRFGAMAEVCEFADRWAWSGQTFAVCSWWRWASATAARLASRTGGG